MIITLKKTAPEAEVSRLIENLEKKCLKTTKIVGENYDVFGLVGDTSVIDDRSLLANPIVYDVKRVAQPISWPTGCSIPRIQSWMSMV